MAKKFEYEYGESVILNGIEWDWETLKQSCHYEFVLEGKTRGNICQKFKIPREILNDWIMDENWEYDKKSHWQRPYSYRIDSAINDLILNVSKLAEIQEKVKDIDFKKENLLSRIKVDIEVKEKKEFVKYKTFILEKYTVLVEGFDEDEMDTEIRYKTEINEGEILIKYLKEKGRRKLK